VAKASREKKHLQMKVDEMRAELEAARRAAREAARDGNEREARLMWQSKEEMMRENQKRIEHLGHLGAKRRARQQLILGWSVWHSLWSGCAHQRNLLRKAGARLIKPKLAMVYSLWKQDWETELAVSLKERAARAEAERASERERATRAEAERACVQTELCGEVLKLEVEKESIEMALRNEVLKLRNELETVQKVALDSNAREVDLIAFAARGIEEKYVAELNAATRELDVVVRERDQTRTALEEARALAAATKAVALPAAAPAQVVRLHAIGLASERLPVLGETPSIVEALRGDHHATPARMYQPVVGSPIPISHTAAVRGLAARRTTTHATASPWRTSNLQHHQLSGALGSRLDDTAHASMMHLAQSHERSIHRARSLHV